MNDLMEINGKQYDSVKGSLARFDITLSTWHRWRRRYGLHPALKIGHKTFYDREQVDNLIGQKLTTTTE